jgi:hypothetical protein
LLQWSKGPLPKIEAAWDRTLGYVKRSADFCGNAGINFAIVYVGSDPEVKHILDPVGTIESLIAMGGPHRKISWDMTKSIKRVDDFCSKHGIPMISLVEPLAYAQKESGRHVFGDHFTMFGHQITARVLHSAVNGSTPRFVASARFSGTAVFKGVRPKGIPAGYEPGSVFSSSGPSFRSVAISHEARADAE